MRTSSGVTQIEVIVIIALTTALGLIGFFALRESRAKAWRLKCADNTRQLDNIAQNFANEDGQGRYTPEKRGSRNLNYLWRFSKCSTDVFYCPATGRRLRMEPTFATNGVPFYWELSTSARDRWDRSCSYQILGWFADMENYWNGNRKYMDNSRFVEKTISTLKSYKHENEAFGLLGTVASPATTWLFTDSDPVNSPFFPDTRNNHGTSGANVAFSDGHAEWLTREKFVHSYELSQDNNRARELPRQ